jgi:hypothetical protein
VQVALHRKALPNAGRVLWQTVFRRRIVRPRDGQHSGLQSRVARQAGPEAKEVHLGGYGFLMAEGIVDELIL